MKKRVLMFTLALTGAALTAWAADTEYSGTFCSHQKTTVLYSAPEVTVLTWESWGIETPASPSDPLKNASVHCVGYGRITQGKMSSTGSCLWTDPTGDTSIGEFEIVPDRPGVWTFLSGTGKWNGIKGSGTFRPASRGKNFTDGTVAVCTTHSGKYTLP